MPWEEVNKMEKESMVGIGMGWLESKDKSLSTEQLRTNKGQNWEPEDDLDAAAEDIAQGREGIRVQAEGKTWVSVISGKQGGVRWMLE